MIRLKATNNKHSLTEKCFRLRTKYDFNVEESEKGLFVEFDNDSNLKGFKRTFKKEEFPFIEIEKG